MKGMSKERIHRFKIQALIFFGLFILVEIGMRILGLESGSLLDDFEVEDNPVYIQRFYNDEKGIDHIFPADTTVLMKGTVVNRQGFRGSMDYTRRTVDSLRRNTGRETVMFIGDSYTEGCCADNVKNSFPDLLERSGVCNVLNFGVAAADPLQYQLVAEKYVKALKPDRVVIVVYFGNDILYYNRVATPGVPLTYPFKNNKWLYAVAPNHLSGKLNYVLKTPIEAYNFYRDHYTLGGENRNVVEKALGYSVILSKIYLLMEHKLAKRAWEKKNAGVHIDGNEITHRYLQGAVNACDSAGVPYLFLGIPAPMEANEGEKLKEKYAIVFKNIEWYVPYNLTLKDYDGTSVANHFNNDGHRKYAAFIRELLKEKEIEEKAN
jgi:hypothetical protein